MNPEDLLLIHTDERDRQWFSPLLESEYRKILFCEDFISPHGLDGAESGLVSMMVASHSDDFIGTICSTFTSYINRMRMYNGKKEEFKFLFPMMNVPLDEKGRMVYRRGVYNPEKSALLEDEIERRGLSADYVSAIIDIVRPESGGKLVWAVIRATPEQRARAFLEAMNARTQG